LAGSIKNFRQLIAWQKAKALAVLIYEITKQYPREELFGMVAQLRRAAVSVPSNIAEGQGRNTAGEFKQFLGIAKGSMAELITLIDLSKDLKYIDQIKYDEVMQHCEEVYKLVNGLLKSL
jgi:four helix bundle protein